MPQKKDASILSRGSVCVWIYTLTTNFAGPTLVHIKSHCCSAQASRVVITTHSILMSSSPYLWYGANLGWIRVGGVWGFSKVVATFSHVGVSFNILTATTGDVWIIPSFRILGLCAALWAHFMCHHELWPTSASHPFSFLNSSLGLAGGKYYQKITIPDSI